LYIPIYEFSLFHAKMNYKLSAFFWQYYFFSSARTATRAAADKIYTSTPALDRAPAATPDRQQHRTAPSTTITRQAQAGLRPI
jgi:hypothetical protein